MSVVLAQARQALKHGAKRFCLGAAWRTPPKRDFAKVLTMIRAIKDLGLETCVTLGTLNEEQAQKLKENGLDYYNHNLDTSEDFYHKIITTHTYQDRLTTIQHVAKAGLHVCCGGILGMGESREDRVGLLLTLKSLPCELKSIPINRLINVQGTPLADTKKINMFEFIRTIAVARILFPTARIRLSAGRDDMSSTEQAWCYMAGANSIFIGDKLLTQENPSLEKDRDLLKQLSLPTRH